MKRLLYLLGVSITIWGCQKTTAPEDSKAPQAPNYVQAFGEFRSVVLKWNEAPDLDIKGYSIYYGTTKGDYTDTLTIERTNICRIENLADDTQYYFAVAAYDYSNNQSELSPVATAITYFAFDDFSQPDGPLDPQKWHQTPQYTTPVVDSQVHAAAIIENLGQIKKSFGQYRLNNPMDNFVVECQFRIGCANVGGAGLMIRAQKATGSKFYQGYNAYLFWNGENWEFRIEESDIDRYAMKKPAPLILHDVPEDKWIKISFKIKRNKLTATLYNLADYSQLGEISARDRRRKSWRPRKKDYFCGFYTCQYGGNTIIVDNFGIQRVIPQN